MGCSVFCASEILWVFERLGLYVIAYGFCDQVIICGWARAGVVYRKCAFPVMQEGIRQVLQAVKK